jgi:hypothetical protein
VSEREANLFEIGFDYNLAEKDLRSQAALTAHISTIVEPKYNPAGSNE